MMWRGPERKLLYTLTQAESVPEPPKAMLATAVSYMMSRPCWVPAFRGHRATSVSTVLYCMSSG